MSFPASLANPLQINDSLQHSLNNISVVNSPVQLDALSYFL